MGDPHYVTAENMERLEAEIARLTAERDVAVAALESIAGFGSVNMAGEWEGGLRDIIRSMTDCARGALEQTAQTKKETK